MVQESSFLDKSQLERSITDFMLSSSLFVYFQKMLPSSKKNSKKYGMGEPPTHQESLLLSHAREVHHAYSHVRGHLAGGAHALYIFGPGAIALAHAAKESFLRIHCAVHVHAAVLKSIAVMTPTHAWCSEKINKKKQQTFQSAARCQYLVVLVGLRDKGSIHCAVDIQSAF
jgi:hypothetical protein